MQAQDLLTKLLLRHDRDVLAEAVGVSVTTISRWVNGRTQPTPEHEARIVQLTEIPTMHYPDQGREQISLPLADDSELRFRVGRLLSRLREALHSKGRLSSRNEALDEISKILFAHSVSLQEGGEGISGLSGSEQPALALRDFVVQAVEGRGLRSIVNGLTASDFELKLRSTEDALASDIIVAFRDLFSVDAPGELLGHDDVLNEVFGSFLVDSFVDEKELGQYLTPPEVIRAMVRIALGDLEGPDLDSLLHPENTGQAGFVLDPSCGVGSFLLEVVHALEPKVASRFGEDGLDSWKKRFGHDVLCGIDKSDRMVRLALAQFALAELPTTHIYRGNALVRSGPFSRVTNDLEGKCRLILTNPPFGAEFKKDELQGYRLASSWTDRSVKRVNSELLFLERYLDWLAPNGQLLAIVPDSILTNRGLFSDLRTAIGSHVDIRAVISLPPETFGSAGTSTKTSVLYLRKAGDRQRRAAFVALCHDIGYETAVRSAQRTKVRNGDGDLPQLVTDFSTDSERDGVSKLIDDIEAAPRWDATYHASLPSEIAHRLETLTGEDLLVADVADLVEDRYNPARLGDKEFRYIEISDIDPTSGMAGEKWMKGNDAPSRARKRVKSGDVLVSTVRPERRAVGVVQEHQDGAVCTTGFAVLRPHTIPSLALAEALRSDMATQQLLRHNVGIAYPAIYDEAILEVLLPIRRGELSTLSEPSERVLAASRELAEAIAALRSRLRGCGDC